MFILLLEADKHALCTFTQVKLIYEIAFLKLTRELMEIFSIVITSQGKYIDEEINSKTIQ